MHLRKSILVTGGSEFMGSLLCERLLQEDCKFICVDNLFTSYKQNIEHLIDNLRFEVICHDITFPLYVEVDEIYNLACPASPIKFRLDPMQTKTHAYTKPATCLGRPSDCEFIFQASTLKVLGTRKYMHSRNRTG